MKKLILAVSGFAFISIAVAQQQVKISGSITNAQSKEIIINTKWRQLSEEAKALIKIQLDDKGSFTFILPTAESTPLILIAGGNTTNMYVHPGDSLNLTADAKSFDETLKYTGKGAEANNYLAKYKVAFAGNTTSDYNKIENFKKTKADYYKSVDSLTTAQNNFLKANQSKKFSKSFTDYVNAEYSYGNVQSKSIYNQMSAALANNNDQIKTLNVKPDLSVYDKINMMNTDAIQSEAYMQTVLGYYGERAKDDYLKTHAIKGMEDFVAVSRNQYDLIKTGLSGNVRDYAAAKFVKLIKTYLTDSALVNYLMTDYTSININKNYLAQLTAKQKSPQEQQAEQRQKAQEQANAQKMAMVGKPAPAFTFADVNGKKYSIADFKGKVVYLDAWASWCGPCKQQIPAAKELEEKFKGKDVVFLGVSIDANEDAWKKCLTDLKPAGIHILSKDDGGAFANNYGLATIPRFFIIDRNGNIIDADAKRPSMGVDVDLEDALKR